MGFSVEEVKARIVKARSVEKVGGSHTENILRGLQHIFEGKSDEAGMKN